MTASRSGQPGDLLEVATAVWQRSVDDGFRGWDPYDGLKSRVLAPLLDRSRLLRLLVIQGVKRSPVNLRPLLGIPAGHNPKGLALLLHAASTLPRLATIEAREDLVNRLASLASYPDGSPYIAGRQHTVEAQRIFAGSGPVALGWGYDFPWQARAFSQQAFAPTVVATSFVVDAFAAAGHELSPLVTESAAAFVRDHLNRHEDDTGVCFSYSPRDRSRVFNASLFAGKILARAARFAEPAPARLMREEAAKAVGFVVARQRPDGGWVYGEAAHWQWIDNLHTGFVLETIDAIGCLLDDRDRWSDSLSKGLDFYREHMLGPDATPYYYADRPWPLDSHTVAQTALTLLAFGDRDTELVALARRVLEIGIARLYDSARRGFWYRRDGLLVDRTIFLRWSQAWMLRALCACIAAEESIA